MIKDYLSKCSFICNDNYFDVYVDGKILSDFFNRYMNNPKYEYVNVYINNFKNIKGICELLSKYKNKQINIILNGPKINLVKEPKTIVQSLKLLPDNVAINYRSLSEDNEVGNKEYASLNPWLTNLSKDDFEIVSSKFNKDSKKYVMVQDQIIKHVYDVIKNTYSNFDELDEYGKIDIIFDYMNRNIKKDDNLDYDPLETAINKKGNIKSIKELFIILTNNRRMKLKTSYREDKIIHGLHYYDFNNFTGKKEFKKTL